MLRVYLKDNKIYFQLNCNHIPTLDYIINQLHYDTTELRAMAKTKAELKKANILKADSSSVNFLRRGKR